MVWMTLHNGMDDSTVVSRRDTLLAQPFLPPQRKKPIHIQPKLDDHLIRAIQVVGQRHLLDKHWVNSTGAAFVKELPSDWQKRINPIYSGAYLQVSALGRN